MITRKEKAIIERLKTCLGYNAPKISQKQFDKIIKYIMENETIGGNPKELVWRLCGCYKGYNYNQAIDIFVDSKDAFYTSELVSFVDGNLDQDYLTKKMIETNDLEFIDKAMSNCANAMANALTKENYRKIRDFYNANINKK